MRGLDALCSVDCFARFKSTWRLWLWMRNDADATFVDLRTDLLMTTRNPSGITTNTLERKTRHAHDVPHLGSRELGNQLCWPRLATPRVQSVNKLHHLSHFIGEAQTLVSPDGVAAPMRADGRQEPTKSFRSADH